MHLSGGIEAASVLPIMLNLNLLAGLPIDKQPVFVILEIDSGGGEFDAGFALAKAIENSRVPVVCIVDGEAASMAFYVLQSCAVRSMTARSTLMWHGVSLAGIESMNIVQMAAFQNRIETMNKASLAHVSKRLKISKEEVAAKIAQHDWWFASDEALAIGAIDTVIP